MNNQKLNKYLVISIVLIFVIIICIAGSLNLISNKKTQTENINSSQKSTNIPTSQPMATLTSTPTVNPAQNIMWSFDGMRWSGNGSSPSCLNPLVFDTPANLNLATNILYPGQIRGGDYKSHGGFRFDGKKNSDITVTVPMDALVYRGVRYIESGEVQYMFDFITPCGIFLRFDHLLTLSPKYQALADTLPAATESSATTPISNASALKGEVLATAVGFVKSLNVSFDFGVYDLRQQNVVSQNPTWVAEHANKKELGFYGICWLDNLSGTSSQKAKSLPGSGTEGKKSDYCK
jgi:hypothetical protein